MVASTTWEGLITGGGQHIIVHAWEIFCFCAFWTNKDTQS